MSAKKVQKKHDPPLFSRINHSSELGYIEGRTGNMFGGKSGWIIGIANDPSNQHEGLVFLQPVLSIRSKTMNVVRSRSHASYRKAVPVQRPKDILRLASGNKHICIEEVHFFERTKAMARQFKDVIRLLHAQGKHIYWTGLPVDFNDEPFELVAWMMAKSDEYAMFPGKCKVCHKSPAHHSQRLMFGHPAPRNTPRFVPDTERYRRMGFTYEARCEHCFLMPPSRPNEHLRRVLALLKAQMVKPKARPQKKQVV